MPHRSGSTEAPRGLVRYGQPAGRWVLLAAMLGSALAFIDATAVNIALPRIGADLGAGAAGLQWTVNGYTLSLASLILLGGSLGDRFGRRRVFVVGVGGFAAASLLCGLATSIEALVAARVVQGAAGALLTPGRAGDPRDQLPAGGPRAGPSARGRGWAASPARPGRSSAAGWSRPRAGGSCS